jgi:hypothetical protein
MKHFRIYIDTKKFEQIFMHRSILSIRSFEHCLN